MNRTNNNKSLSAKQIQEVVAAVTSTSKSNASKAKRRRNKRKSKGKKMAGGVGMSTGRTSDYMTGFGGSSLLEKFIPLNGQKPRVTFNIGGRPQMLTDYTVNQNESAIRVNGRAINLIGATIVTSVGVIPYTPAFIDPRLASITSVYEAYAFREIRLTWVPEFRGTSNGQVGMALAIQDTQSAGSEPATLEQVLNYDPSGSGQITEPFQIVYSYTGMKLFGTSTDSIFNDESQNLLYFYTETSSSNGVTIPAGARLGIILIDYVIDLYLPSKITALPVLFLEYLTSIIDSMGKDPEFLARFVKLFPLASKRLLRYLTVAFLALDDIYFKDRQPEKVIRPPLSKSLLEEAKEDSNSSHLPLTIPSLRRSAI